MTPEQVKAALESGVAANQAKLEAEAKLKAEQEQKMKERELALAQAKGIDTASPAPSAVASKSPTVECFYSRGLASRYIFWDGGVAEFTGGRYYFDPKVVPEDYSPPLKQGKEVTPEQGWELRYKELIHVCTIPNPVFSRVPVPLHVSDAVVLREVGRPGGGTATPGGVGIVGSVDMQALLAGNIR